MSILTWPALCASELGTVLEAGVCEVEACCIDEDDDDDDPPSNVCPSPAFLNLYSSLAFSNNFFISTP